MKNTPKKTETLKRRGHELSAEEKQLELLDDHKAIGIPSFQEKMEQAGLFPLRPAGLEILQVNLGKMCNQTCRHCHVDAGPDRKEIMGRETMEQILDALRKTPVQTVDLTGGAPEMNPNFRWFVGQISDLGKSMIVRCNLTIILANPRYNDLPEFFAGHQVNVVSSLPYFAAKRTDAQRGKGVFEKSIEALKMLNAAGYGKEGTGLKLDLVHNPTGAVLPGDQKELESQFKEKLLTGHGVAFNNLLSITNLPISRFLDYLISSGNYESYMAELANAFNPAAAKGVMCRSTLSAGWDGHLYDCDFNQMLGLKIRGCPAHISEFDPRAFNDREIRIGQHCFGCAAGAGSSCGGATALL